MQKVLIFLLLLNLAGAKQFSYLDSETTSFEISENQAIRILNVRYSGTGEQDGIRIHRNGFNYDMRSRGWTDYNGQNQYVEEYVIVGPAVFSLYKHWNGAFPFVEFEIFNINDNKPLVLSLPEEVASVVVEASEDGENWSQVSTSPLVGDKQFVKVTAE